MTEIATGRRHTVGLRSGGTVVAVGDNGDRQCEVGSCPDIVQVTAGSFQTVTGKDDSTVVSVGLNDDGQCNVGGWMLE